MTKNIKFSIKKNYMEILFNTYKRILIKKIWYNKLDNIIFNFNNLLENFLLIV